MLQSGGLHWLTNAWLLLLWKRGQQGMKRARGIKFIRELSQGNAGSNQPWRYCILRPVVPYKRFREWATQLSRVLLCTCNAWTDTLAREGLWLAKSFRGVGLLGRLYFSRLPYWIRRDAWVQLPKFAHDTHNKTSALPLWKLPITKPANVVMWYQFVHAAAAGWNAVSRKFLAASSIASGTKVEIF